MRNGAPAAWQSTLKIAQFDESRHSDPLLTKRKRPAPVWREPVSPTKGLSSFVRVSFADRGREHDLAVADRRVALEGRKVRAVAVQVASGDRREGLPGIRGVAVLVVLRAIHLELQTDPAGVRITRVVIRAFCGARLVLHTLWRVASRNGRSGGTQLVGRSGGAAIVQNATRHDLARPSASGVLGDLAQRVAGFRRLRVGDVLLDAEDGEGGQDADDGDNDHQFDEREAARVLFLNHDGSLLMWFAGKREPVNGPARDDDWVGPPSFDVAQRSAIERPVFEFANRPWTNSSDEHLVSRPHANFG